MTSSAATPRDALERLLRPRSVAIVGIGPDPASLGRICYANLVNVSYAGDIHLVSRTNNEVAGRPCVPTIDALPEGIDTAILALPRVAIVDAMEACARRNIGAAVIFAAGFAEVDEAGRRDQERIASIARNAGMALAGPNCMGFINYVDGVSAYMGPAHRRPQTKRAAVAVLAQSGGMMGTIASAVMARGLDVSFQVSTGNEAVTTVEDYLAAILESPRLGPIAIFVEGLRQPLRFVELAHIARGLGRPIVMLHTGRSDGAREAALSHTGAIAGDFAVMRTFVEHAGVVLVESLDELIDVVSILARFPDSRRGGLAAFTESGAYKGLMIDVADELGTTFAPLEGATTAAITAAMPAFAQISNPLDLTAHVIQDGSLYAASAKAFVDDDGVAAIVGAFMTGARSLKGFAESSALATLMAAEKPSAVAFIGSGQIPSTVTDAAKENGYPLFASGEAALRAMSHVMAYAARSLASQMPVADVAFIAVSLPPGPGVTEQQAKAIIADAGISIPAGALARSPDEAVAVARDIGYPVVLKAQAAALQHKSDAGGVAVGLQDESAVQSAFLRVSAAVAKARPDIALDGILVERMAPMGVELVVGAKRDPQWGIVTLIGLGGIWIESLRDVALLPGSASREDVVCAMRRLKAVALLNGSRGTNGINFDMVADVVLRLAAIMRALPNVVEIEVNPLAAYPDRVVALDALIITAK